jgi:hypothetical protein
MGSRKAMEKTIFVIQDFSLMTIEPQKTTIYAGMTVAVISFI